MASSTPDPLQWPAQVMSAAQVASTVHVHPKTIRQDIRRSEQLKLFA